MDQISRKRKPGSRRLRAALCGCRLRSGCAQTETVSGSPLCLPQPLHNGAAVNGTVRQQRDQNPQNQKQRYDR